MGGGGLACAAGGGVTGGIYPGPGPDRQCRPLRRSDALAILAICAAIVALAILGAVI